MNNGFVIRKFAESDYSAIINYRLPENQAIYTSLPKDIIKDYKVVKFNQPFVIYSGDSLIGCFALYTNKAGNIYTNNQHAIIFKNLFHRHSFSKKGICSQNIKKFA